MSNIRFVIADIRERTERVYLSADEHSNGDHHRRWKAIREGEAELVEYLRATYDARVYYSHFNYIIRMHGVVSSATDGHLSAFRNWARLAEKKADAS